MKNNSIKKKILDLPYIILVSGVLFLILSLTTFNIGCQLLDDTGNLQDDKADVSSNDSTGTEDTNTSGEGETGEESDEGDETGEDEDTPLDNDDSSGEDSENQAEEQSDETQDDLDINVYYADSQVSHLVGESRGLSPGGSKYVEALNELMKLPVNSSLIRLIPDTTVINSVVLEDGIAKIDFSANFVEDRLTSDTEDILLVYSVVNTLTEFSDVDAVSFYIDGKKLNVLGMLDLQNPCYRRTDLIRG